jgi:hypothetical protein
MEIILSLVTTLACFGVLFHRVLRIEKMLTGRPVEGAPRIIFPDKRRKPKVPVEPAE